MSKYTFLITSAINTKFGVFDAETRLNQTVSTIQSIKQRVPDADLFLLEMSAIALTQDQSNTLEPLVKSIVNFNSDPSVVGLYNSTDNWDIVKNVTEVMCFGKALKNLHRSLNQFSNTQRIFKISGRYGLNNNFDIGYYDQYNIQNHIVISNQKNSQFDYNLTLISHQFMSRLWSWPVSLMEEIITVYDNSLAYMGERISAGGYADIEHCLYKFLDKEKVIQKVPLGIFGNIGPNGMPVQE
jgi:hypothetical protein